MALADFITGVRTTSLKSGELVSALFIPKLPDTVGSGFQKLGSRKYLVISIAMVSAVIGLDNTGHINFARVAVGSCSPVAQCLTKLQVALIGLNLPDLNNPDLVSPEHLSTLSPIDDTRASATFRTDAVAELCQRTVIAAATGAG